MGEQMTGRLERCSCRDTREAKRKKEARKDSVQSQREPQPCQHLDFRCLASTMVRGYICGVLSHPVCGTLLWKSQETETGTSNQMLQRKEDENGKRMDGLANKEDVSVFQQSCCTGLIEQHYRERKSLYCYGEKWWLRYGAILPSSLLIEERNHWFDRGHNSRTLQGLKNGPFLSWEEKMAMDRHCCTQDQSQIPQKTKGFIDFTTIKSRVGGIGLLKEGTSS